MKLYTIIIPHHNTPDLLSRCIDSIPQREDIQIIVVDDNSDEDKKPIESIRPEIEYIYISKDDSKGAGRARNIGLQHAKGKWLLFADADDYYTEGFINVIDKYSESHYDIVYLNFEYRDGETLEMLPDLPFKKYFDLYDGTLEYVDEIRFHHNVPWTKLISSSYVKKHNLYFEEVQNGNDILFSMMAGYYTKNIAVEKEHIYVYLKNINSISTTTSKPVSFYLCKINHRIKQNAFYSFIGHKSYRISLYRIIGYYIKQSGFNLLYKLIILLPNMFRNRNEWVNIVRNSDNL